MGRRWRPWRAPGQWMVDAGGPDGVFGTGFTGDQLEELAGEFDRSEGEADQERGGGVDR